MVISVRTRRSETVTVNVCGEKKSKLNPVRCYRSEWPREKYIEKKLNTKKCDAFQIYSENMESLKKQKK